MKPTTILNALVLVSMDRTSFHINKDAKYQVRVRQFGKFYNWLTEYFAKIQQDKDELAINGEW